MDVLKALGCVGAERKLMRIAHGKVQTLVEVATKFRKLCGSTKVERSFQLELCNLQTFFDVLECRFAYEVNHVAQIVDEFECAAELLGQISYVTHFVSSAELFTAKHK